MRTYDPSQDYIQYPTLAPLPEGLTFSLAQCPKCGSQDFQIRLPGWTAVCKECGSVLSHSIHAEAAPKLPARKENALTFSAFQLIAVSSRKWYSGPSYIVLRPDGTLRADTNLHPSLQAVLEWSEIVSVVTNSIFIAGLRADGTLRAVGLSDNDNAVLRSWTDVISIAAISNGLIALRSNGTVQAIGLRPAELAQLEKWTDIVAIAAGGSRIAGLRADGTVRALGNWDAVYGWDKITAIATDGTCIAGLRENGTVITAGFLLRSAETVIGQWKKVKSICVGSKAIAAVHENGKISVQKTSTESILTSKDIELAQTWSNIESLELSANCIIARRADGFIHCTNSRIQRFIVECLD